MKKKFKISWWKTDFGNEEIKYISNSIKNENISQGKVTEKFEKSISTYLKSKNTIAVTSGTAALTLILLALKIKPDDEIIIPNRTWIATAHSAAILNAKIVIADVKKSIPIIDETKIEKLITNKTKAIILVNINGRNTNINFIKNIIRGKNIKIIEDASQAMGSKNGKHFIGTKSFCSFFSLSVAKSISTGQGGFITTNNNKFAKELRLRRTHGVININYVDSFPMLGFNFRYNDILASIGLVQLKKISQRKKKLIYIYNIYKKYLTNPDFKIIPVDILRGEIPVYIEYLVRKKIKYIKYLNMNGIEIRSFYPDISQAKYLNLKNPNNNKSIYAKEGVYLPCGPAQKINDIKKVINLINNTIL